MQLAHLGAEVIRVESTKRPDINRCHSALPERKPGFNRGGSFNQWNQGKRSIQLDLSKPEAIEIAYQLAAHCDVVTENYAPGAVAADGAWLRALQTIKPDIIMCSLSGYGQTGPFSRHVSYGALMGGQSGLVRRYPATPKTASRAISAPVTATRSRACSALLRDQHRPDSSRAHRSTGSTSTFRCYEAMEMFMPEALLAIRG